jgi:predicted MFS family arabinose efflux permease
MGTQNQEFGSAKAWVVCLVAALFFFFTFIQMSILDSLGEPMMRDLGLQASGIANLAGSYFYGNILFLFPAGIILDRYSTRHVMLSCLVVMSLSTLGLAFVHSLLPAMACKFVFGMCGAFCLLSCVRLASRWFPGHRLAFVIGMILMVAMSGCLVAQTPFTLLADSIGWRMSFVVDAAIGMAIAAAIFWVVQDWPADVEHKVDAHGGAAFRHAIGKVLCNRQNWLAGLYTALMNLPVMVLFVFGNLFLEQAYGLDRTAASLVLIIFLVGVILGCPAFGWISDKLGRRKLPMILAAVLAIIVALPLLLAGHLSRLDLYVVFFALGFITSAQVISYPLVVESNPPEFTATAEGVTSVLIMLGGLSPQLFAYLLKWHWAPHYLQHVPQYGWSSYHHALLLLPISLILALATAFFLRDVHQPDPVTEEQPLVDASLSNS